MPRYCAVKVCRNRGGTTSKQDNKRISFYPFPLQDKHRLQKWVDNMKREKWTPSRHQYLCSEHFTEDCFDIRWGIRYLKNTAIPTIFPSAEDDGEKKGSTVKRSPTAKPSMTDSELKDFVFNKRPLILSRTCKNVQSDTAKKNAVEHGEMMIELPLVLGAGSNTSDVQTGGGGMAARPCLALSSCSEPQPTERADSTVTVLCCESPGPFSDGEINVDAAALQLMPGFSFVPVELVRDEACLLEERGPGEGEHVSVYEHSYCRSDTDKDQLWRKILSLHAKILELDRREEMTVAKIHAVENEIALLKRDGAVFKEKQKVLEDYISSVLL